MVVTWGMVLNYECNQSPSETEGQVGVGVGGGGGGGGGVFL